jgi:hypothetical protein
MASQPAGFSATEGRQKYLDEVGLKRQGPDWWQAVDPPGEPARLDYLATTDAWQRVEVPQTLLGEDMEPFRETVHFLGAPLAEAIGNADTVMERRGEFSLNTPVETRLVAFGNVSRKPIELRGDGSFAGQYRLFVTLSPTQESPGEMTFDADGDLGGTFHSRVSLARLFELRPLGGGNSVFVDTAQVELPGFPMELASSGGHWTRRPDRADAVGEVDTSMFYPGEISIITQKVVPDREGDPETIAACLKQQATQL